MNKLFIISYDLNSIDKDYNGLYQAIKDLAPNAWKHPLESLWCISVDGNYTANMIFEKIKQAIDSDDRLFIVDITKADRQGWLARDFWSWIKEL